MTLSQQSIQRKRLQQTMSNVDLVGAAAVVDVLHHLQLDFAAGSRTTKIMNRLKALANAN